MQKFKPCWSAYGGIYRNKDNQRAKARPVAINYSMHLVLRSSQAKGSWSFRNHPKKIKKILDKFTAKYEVKIISWANVGNHLHFHLKFAKKALYFKFIRAVTSAIVMAVTKVNKFSALKKHFWDYRPFSRIVFGKKAEERIEDYVELNQIEADGWTREQARDIQKGWKLTYG